MTAGCVELTVLNEKVIADPSGAAYLPAHETLLVADLHFEKGSAFAAKGQMLPPYDTRSTLGALQEAMDRHRPARVIALGDSFHDEEAGARIATDDVQTIKAMTAATDWIWLTGNHDEELPPGIGGMVTQELVLGQLILRHEPSAGPTAGEMAGHLHPAAVVRTRNRRLRRRCFVGDGQRLILPSFGSFTGGLDISDPAFAGLFDGPPTAWVLGRDQVYEIPPARIAGVA